MPGGPKSSIPRQGVRLPAGNNEVSFLLTGEGTEKSRRALVTVNTVRNEKFYNTLILKTKK